MVWGFGGGDAVSSFSLADVSDDSDDEVRNKASRQPTRSKAPRSVELGSFDSGGVEDMRWNDEDSVGESVWGQAQSNVPPHLRTMDSEEKPRRVVRAENIQTDSTTGAPIISRAKAKLTGARICSLLLGGVRIHSPPWLTVFHLMFLLLPLSFLLPQYTDQTTSLLVSGSISLGLYVILHGSARIFHNKSPQVAPLSVGSTDGSVRELFTALLGTTGITLRYHFFRAVCSSAVACMGALSLSSSRESTSMIFVCYSVCVCWSTCLMAPPPEACSWDMSGSEIILSRPLLVTVLLAVGGAGYATSTMHILAATLVAISSFGVLPPTLPLTWWLVEQLEIYVLGGTPQYTLLNAVLCAGTSVAVTFVLVWVATTGSAHTALAAAVGAGFGLSLHPLKGKLCRSIKLPAAVTSLLPGLGWVCLVSVTSLTSAALGLAIAGSNPTQCIVCLSTTGVLAYAALGAFGALHIVSLAAYGNFERIKSGGGTLLSSKKRTGCKFPATGGFRAGLVTLTCGILWGSVYTSSAKAIIDATGNDPGIAPLSSHLASRWFFWTCVIRAFRVPIVDPMWGVSEHMLAAVLDVGLALPLEVGESSTGFAVLYNSAQWPIRLWAAGAACRIFSRVGLIVLHMIRHFVDHIKNKHARPRKFGQTLIASIVCIPISLVSAFACAVLRAPPLPVFGLPLWIVGFPRPSVFFKTTSGLHTLPNATVYSPVAADVIHRLRSAEKEGLLGARGLSIGRVLLLRHQGALLIVRVFSGNVFQKRLLLVGLELAETSCHAVEATTLDNTILADAKTQSIKCWQHLTTGVAAPWRITTTRPLLNVQASVISVAEATMVGVASAGSFHKTRRSAAAKAIKLLLENNVMAMREASSMPAYVKASIPEAASDFPLPLPEIHSLGAPSIGGTNLHDERMLAILAAWGAMEVWGGQLQSERALVDAFNGILPSSVQKDWIQQQPSLLAACSRAMRVSFKMAYDEVVLAEDVPDFLDEDFTWTDVFGTIDEEWYLGNEADKEWMQVLSQPCAKSQSNRRCMALRFESGARTRILSRDVADWGVVELSSIGVEAIWAGLAWELLFATNDDEERASVQASSRLMRNITVQAAAPPLGYAVYADAHDV